MWKNKNLNRLNIQHFSDHRRLLVWVNNLCEFNELYPLPPLRSCLIIICVHELWTWNAKRFGEKLWYNESREGAFETFLWLMYPPNNNKSKALMSSVKLTFPFEWWWHQTRYSSRINSEPLGKLNWQMFWKIVLNLILCLSYASYCNNELQIVRE